MKTSIAIVLTAVPGGLALLVAAILFVFGRTARLPYVNWLAAAFALASIGIVTSQLSQLYETDLNVLVSCAAVFAGIACFGEGLARRMGQHVRWWPVLVLALAAVTVGMINVRYMPEVTYRPLAVNAAIGLSFGWIAFDRRRMWSVGGVPRWALLSVALTAVASLVLSFGPLVSGYALSLEAYHESLLWLTVRGVVAVCVVGLSFATFALGAHDQLRALEDAIDVDALTGLRNRRSFWNRSRAVLREAASLNMPATLVMVDIDHFKRINDQHGHPAGDAVIAQVGRSIAETSRAGDVAGRLGGEEFGLLLVHSDTTGGQIWAASLRQQLAIATFAELPEGHRVTVSAGIAQAEPGETVQALYARADEALYEAKRTGRDRVCVATPRALARARAS